MESQKNTSNIKTRINKTLAGVALAGLMAIVTIGGTVSAAPPNPGPIQSTDQGLSMSEALLLEQWSDVWVRSSLALSNATVERGISASEALQLEEFGVYMRIGNRSGEATAVPATVGKAVITRGTSMYHALLLEEFGVFVRADNTLGNALLSPTRSTQVPNFPEDGFTYGWQ